MTAKQQLKLSIIIVIIGTVALVTGVSYAIFNSVINSTKNQVIKAGSIYLELVEPSSGLILNNLEEMTDAQGLAQTTYYQFTVENKGTAEAYYALKMIDDTVANTNYGGTVLDDAYIRVGITVDNVEYGPVGLEEANRIILNDTIASGVTKTYKLRVWLNFDGLTNEQKLALLNEEAYFKINIESGQIFETNNPSCTFASTTIISSTETTYVMQCIDETEFKDSTIVASDFDLESGQTVTNIDKTAITNGFSYTITVTGTKGYIYLKKNSVIDISNNRNERISPNLDTSGANEPELVTGMIPVYYDGTTWRKADSSNGSSNYKWYEYGSGTGTKMWANAVTVTSTNRATYQSAAIGTEIPMSDINTMWVWIPRFSAVTPSNYNGGTAAAPNAISVTFVNNTTTALDSFTFGDQTLSGFWYAKFEISHSTLSSSTTANNLGCSTETCSNANGLLIKPNVTSLRWNSVSNFFYASRSMEQNGNAFGFDNIIDTTLDTHMSKNNEWGAIAYLTHSVYGRCTSSTSCTELTKNNCSTFTTGIGGDTVNASASSTTCTTAANKYNGTYGVLASTTGNIYGIYDMSGGSYAFVMGNYNNTISSSGFSSIPNTKYYNLYTGTSYTGHALTETLGWYSDYSTFVNSNYSWVARGGYYNEGVIAGLFSFYYNGGGSDNLIGVHFTVVK